VKRFIPLILAAVALLILPLSTKNQFILHSFIMVLFYAYLATSWNIVGGFAGQLSLGHSAFFAIGGYTSTLLFIYLNVSPWLGMLLGGFLAALIAVLIGIPCFRLRGAYYSLATIAFAEGLSIILQTLDQVGPVDLGGAQGLMVPLRMNSGVLGFQFFSKLPYYYIILVFLAVVLFVSWYIERSRLGYYLTALREDEDAAKALGINTQKSKLIAAGLSAFFTGVGGTFFAQLIRYLEPATVAGLDISVQIVFLAVVGGMGTVFGPFLGAILLTTAAQLTQVYLGGSIPGLHLIIYGSAVVLVVLYQPKGVMQPLAKLQKLLSLKIASAFHGRNLEPQNEIEEVGR
jgi:branched-chain amino acid transport system permease protein